MRKIEKVALHLPIQKQLKLKIKNEKQYSDLSPKQHRILRNRLLESQRFLCCYCECKIDKYNYHIEHFFEQDDFSIHHIHSLDYEINMLVSCDGDINKIKMDENEDEKKERIKNTSCGHKKGKAYHNNVSVNYLLLLNPHNSISNLFSYMEGYISPSSTCTDDEREMVNYTIKRLSLDSDKLNRRRIGVIDSLRKEIEPLTPMETVKYLQDILDDTKDKLYPYFSTLLENFSYLLKVN